LYLYLQIGIMTIYSNTYDIQYSSLYNSIFKHPMHIEKYF